jgi:hypothetical protein
MSNGGYYLCNRGALSHRRFKPRGAFTNFEAWHWLIGSAAFAPRDIPVMVGQRRELIGLQEGQLSFSIRFLGRAWRWSLNRVRRFLDELESDGSIHTETVSGQTVVTLCNWLKYQRPNVDNEADTQDGTLTDTQTDTAETALTDCYVGALRDGLNSTDTQANTQTDTQADTKKKELNKRKKDNARSAEGFDGWYAIYPRKTGRIAAEKAYRKALAGLIDHERLMSRTAAFAASWNARPKEERKFIPYPASWLNDGCFLDDPEGNLSQGAVEAPKVAAANFSDTDWRRRLDHYALKQEWAELDWGPRPGSPGCLVPARLLVVAAPVATGSAA